MADTAIKKKKLEIMEFPTISNTASGQYDNLKNESRKKKNTAASKPASSIYIPDTKDMAEKIERVKIKVFGLSISRIKLVLFYVAVLILAAFSKVWVLYSTSSLAVQKAKIENELSALKLEVEELENTYITNYDLKQIEKKSKSMGFIPKDIKNIDISQ